MLSTSPAAAGDVYSTSCVAGQLAAEHRWLLVTEMVSADDRPSRTIRLPESQSLPWSSTFAFIVAAPPNS